MGRIRKASLDFDPNLAVFRGMTLGMLRLPGGIGYDYRPLLLETWATEEMKKLILAVKPELKAMASALREITEKYCRVLENERKGRGWLDAYRVADLAALKATSGHRARIGKLVMGSSEVEVPSDDMGGSTSDGSSQMSNALVTPSPSCSPGNDTRRSEH